MATLYLIEQGSVLSKVSERLVVEKEGRKILEVPAIKVDRVLVFGNVQISTQALAFLLSQGIETSFLSLRGQLKGRLSPIESKDVYLRMAQYECHRDEQFKVNFSRSLVSGKIRNQRTLIMRYARNYPEIDFHNALRTLQQYLEALERKQTTGSIMGMEGYATAVYFQTFSKMFRKEMRFESRTRRPPRDPVNSLLSFGYTLIGTEMVSLLSALGLDPYIGFYHGIKYGRPALALDLIEEFRQPIVDRFVLYLVNKGIFKKEDFFETEEGAVVLREEPRKRFFLEYERYMNAKFRYPSKRENLVSFRDLFRRQIQRLSLAIKSKGLYLPFKYGL